MICSSAQFVCLLFVLLIIWLWWTVE